jgi:hypothetical protein
MFALFVLSRGLKSVARMDTVQLRIDFFEYRAHIL